YQIWTHYTDNLNSQCRVLSPYDVILLTINNTKYFGIIVYTRHTRTKSKETGATTENVSDDKWTIVQPRKGDHNVDKVMNIVRLTHRTTTKRQITAIMNLSQWPQYKSLLAPTQNDLYYQLAEQLPVTIDRPDFNEEQRKAIKVAVNMFGDIQDRLFILHGPPGTGKSKTIAGLVYLFRPPDDKHLCDYFLEYIVLTELCQKLKRRENFNRCTIEKQIEKKLLKNAQIIISTLNYTASSRLRLLNNSKTGVSFIIVDEACQAFEELFPNEHFYDSQLTYGGVHQSYPLKPLFHVNIQALNHKHDAFKSAYNVVEARMLTRVCRLIVLCLSGNNYKSWRFNSDDERIISTQQRIGIITPYKGQVREIEKQLKLVGIYHTEIGSVDSFQGKQKDIILISTVRCKNTGFLDISNRLNVMLTRAKYGEYIFGNLTHLKQYDHWKELIDNAIGRKLLVDTTEPFDAIKIFENFVT
ncbi:unnamed protein product, partial [Didymodactylos carnosus]